MLKLHGSICCGLVGQFVELMEFKRKHLLVMVDKAAAAGGAHVKSTL